MVRPRLKSEEPSEEPTIAGTDPRGMVSPVELRLARARLNRSLFERGDEHARLGRFVVLEQLGAGAMGQVHAAYDPQLDRKVALKLLRFSDAAQSDRVDRDRERLLREARAMANIGHPNVLTVFEVGTVDSEVFIAMEYAGGGTLREWAAEERRSWPEILAACLQAAAGLSAAHRAGLIHRDFKPDNVLLTGDGHVRVADFGLVGVSAERLWPGRELESTGATTTLTQDGAIVGTPAYMAPELQGPREASPAADQFAFCVSMWELLFGRRPFAGTSYRELARNAEAGELADPANSDVPGWIREVLRRGLDPMPERRFDSMDALADALADDPRARAKRRFRTGITVLGLVAGVAGLAAITLRPEPTAAVVDPCAQSKERIAQVWNPTRRAALERAFDASGAEWANEAAGVVTSQLDTYAEAWRGAHLEVCEATHVRHEQSDAMFDLKMNCLTQLRGELDAVVSLLAEEVDAEMVRQAPGAVQGLRSVSRCADEESLRKRIPLPDDPVVAGRIEGLRHQLEQARALHAAGKWEQARDLSRSVVEQSNDVDFAPLRAEALYALATLGRVKPARQRQVLHDAAIAGARAGDDHLVASAWTDLVLVIGYNEGHQHEALSLEPFARAAVARAGDDPILEADLLNSLGIVLDELGRNGEAQRAFERSLALREGVLGENHALVAASLNNLGDSLRLSGDLSQARDRLSRAMRIKRAVLGAHHRDIAYTAQNLAAVQLELGELEDARRNIELAIELYAVDASELPGPVTMLASIDRLEGNPARAATRLREATDDATEHFARSQVGAEAWRELAMALEDLGELDPAHEAALRSVQILTTTDDFAPQERADSLVVLGRILLRKGQVAAAKKELDRARAAWALAPNQSGSAVVSTATLAGEIAMAEGDVATAREHLVAAVDAAQTRLGAEHPVCIAARRQLAELDARGG